MSVFGDFMIGQATKQDQTVRELGERVNKADMALRLVLLFHSGSPWDKAKNDAWNGMMDSVLGSVETRDARVVGSNGDGTRDGAHATNEATTKNLCNAVRAALGAITGVN